MGNINGGSWCSIKVEILADHANAGTKVRAIQQDGVTILGKINGLLNAGCAIYRRGFKNRRRQKPASFESLQR